MSYMSQLDAWLTEVLSDVRSGESEAQWQARVKPEIARKILESYRNGQQAPVAVRPRLPKIPAQS